MRSRGHHKGTNASAFLLCLAVAGWSVWAPLAFAQTATTLSVQLYGGLSITGQVGQVYHIEYATSLAEPTTWIPLDYLVLPRSPYLYIDTRMPAAPIKRFYQARESTVLPVADMVYIPPGAFTMGSPESEAERSTEETQHRVTLTRGFWMGKYEVTQGEYLELMGSNPSRFRNVPVFHYGVPGSAVTNELRHPVEQVSWIDATNYCRRLTQIEVAAGRLPAEYTYRLPTEAEWEYACRGGATGAFHYGPALSLGMANFYGFYEYDSTNGTRQVLTNTSLGRTTLVGSYSPNAFGLYDMHGNVLEWCLDWFGSYPNSVATDPVGPATGSLRVARGGSWFHEGRYCRSASRSLSPPPRYLQYHLGFRVVLAGGQ